MSKADSKAADQAAAMAEYKEILREVLDSRPSGTRQRLATALGKNRSFVSQIASPQYSTPVPARHLDTIFDICHFPPVVRDQFMDAYARAHPVRIAHAGTGVRMRRHTVLLPDLGDPGRNEKLDMLVADFVRKLIKVMND